jgi:hypothetical protein
MIKHRKENTMTWLKMRLLIPFPLLVVFLALTSCGPSGPLPGTPAFYWQAAKETFAARDYLKTADHLARLTKSENEFALRAEPWGLVLTAGLAKAYIDLAGGFESGGKAGGKDSAMPLPLRKKMSDYRTLAERRALEFGETFIQFEKSSKDQNIALEFTYPATNMADIPELTRIKGGAILPDSTLSTVETRLIEQSIAKSAGAAVGAAGDPAKAQTLFQAGSVQVPRDVFMVAMAGNLHDLAQLFTRGKLDKLDRLEFFCNKGLEALKPVKQTKEIKDLVFNLEWTLKGTKK